MTLLLSTPCLPAHTHLYHRTWERRRRRRRLCWAVSGRRSPTCHAFALLPFFLPAPTCLFCLKPDISLTISLHFHNFGCGFAGTFRACTFCLPYLHFPGRLPLFSKREKEEREREKGDFLHARRTHTYTFVHVHLTAS